MLPSHAIEAAEGHTVPMETERGREHRDGCKSTPGVSKAVVSALNDGSQICIGDDDVT